MTMEAINIEIEELTPEQASAIWQEQKKRPANYLEFVMYVRAKSIGQAFNVKVHGDTDAKREEHARSIRKWFGEAAKERVRFDTVDGKTIETPEPCAIRWKEESHKEKRTVKDADGKKGEVEIKVIDLLHGKLVAAAEVRARGRAAADNTEQVDEIVKGMTFAEGSKTVELPDGRKAKLTRSGHWRAPKVEPQQAPLPDASTNGSASSESVKVGAA